MVRAPFQLNFMRKQIFRCTIWLDPELVDLVRNYEEENKPVLYELFSKYKDKNVITFHTREEAEKWITEELQ